MEVETFSYDMAVKTNTLTELLYSIYNMNICKREAMKVVLLASEVPRTLPRLISPQDSLCLIVVIGESYNKYHSSLYGYSLDTTPNMVEARDDSCLYVFNNVLTPWNMTSNAIKNIFSLNSIANNESWTDYTLFPSLFKAAGYSVYFWDNQNSGISSDVFDFSLNGIIHNPNIAKV
jgi:heptose-I-phosphate ethanolaminephosphotransferase